MIEHLIGGLGITGLAPEGAELLQGAAHAAWYCRFDSEGKTPRQESNRYHVLDVLARQATIPGFFPVDSSRLPAWPIAWGRAAAFERHPFIHFYV